MENREAWRSYHYGVLVVLLAVRLPVAWGQNAPVIAPSRPAQKAAPAQPATAVQAETQAPVVVRDRRLFSVNSRLYSFSPQERARAISERLERLSQDNSISMDSIGVQEQENTSQIIAGDLVIMTVTEQDARAARQPRVELAQQYVQTIRATLAQLRSEFNWKTLLLGVLWAFLATLVFAAVIISFRYLFPRLYRLLDAWRGTRIRSLRIQRLELLPAHRITNLLISTLRLARVLIVLTLFYFYISLVFNFFPWTRGYARMLIGYVLVPVRSVGAAIADYLPNLFFVIVIILVTYYAIKFVKLFFREVGRGTLELPGFYADWAEPTYKIARFLIIAFGAVVLFPYLPGSRSPAFQGISIFLGLLFSLGSTSAIANMVAGTVLTYTRAFQIGDRVRIGDAQGDVIERTLLVTRLRTIKNEDISLPNALVLSSQVTNFSSSAKRFGLILHTSVTIGYDTPWRQVHELLLGAAVDTEHILKEPEPFVLQTSLDDFYVTYQINAYTDRPAVMARTYSDLHQNIQDRFHEAGVEIMSPHYEALRDGTPVAAHSESLAANRKASTWQFFPTRDDSPERPATKDA